MSSLRPYLHIYAGIGAKNFCFFQGFFHKIFSNSCCISLCLWQFMTEDVMSICLQLCCTNHFGVHNQPLIDVLYAKAVKTTFRLVHVTVNVTSSRVLFCSDDTSTHIHTQTPNTDTQAENNTCYSVAAGNKELDSGLKPHMCSIKVSLSKSCQTLQSKSHQFT